MKGSFPARILAILENLNSTRKLEKLAPGQTGLEQPDELIEVVQRDFLRLGRHKNCEFIARLQIHHKSGYENVIFWGLLSSSNHHKSKHHLEGLKRAAILARRDGEVWV